MKNETLLTDLKNNFSGIWRSKVRGKTTEIITPYATTNNRFVSVFITFRDNHYIISDGGWVNSGVYDNQISKDDACFNKILFHFSDAFQIKETDIKSNEISQYSHFYLKCDKTIDIPSRVLDMASFIQNIVSTSLIEFEDKAEKETKARFVSLANDYLKSIVPLEKIKFNTYLNSDRRELKFNALYFYKPNEITLINYITGSTISHFSNSIFKSNTLFEMADESLYKDYIRKKITLLDTNADGYVTNKIGHYLIHLQKQTGATNLEWSTRERLVSLL